MDKIRGLIDGITDALGSTYVALTAILVLAATLALGWATGFSRAWRDAVEVSSAFITLTIVIAIQHTQSREAKAIQIKLDEMVRSMETASDEVIDIERQGHEELDKHKDRTKGG